MRHHMKLSPVPFEQIQSGEKQYEIRLNDEKRQALKVGDEIEFSKMPDLAETLVVRVTGLEYFENFEETFDALKFYYPNWFKRDWAEAVREYYTREEEEMYGVVAIRIEQI